MAYGPSSRECRFISWAKIAALFSDVPEIRNYIEQFALFYKGQWQSTVAAATEQPGPTAFDLLVPRLIHVVDDDGDDDVKDDDDDADRWHFAHLVRSYFVELFDRCRRQGLGPIHNVWLGRMGVPFIEKERNGRRVNPNAMIELANGTKWIVRDGRFVQGTFNPQNVTRWSYIEIATRFGFPMIGRARRTGCMSLDDGNLGPT
jgi:hypothetical protein